jgi:hypothetical protein
MNGSQYLTTMISGFIFLSLFPTKIQFSGFIELITELILTFSGGGSEENCVVPGKRKDGY